MPDFNSTVLDQPIKLQSYKLHIDLSDDKNWPVHCPNCDHDLTETAKTRHLGSVPPKTFEGKITILLNITSEVDALYFNGLNLDVEKAILEGTGYGFGGDRKLGPYLWLDTTQVDDEGVYKFTKSLTKGNAVPKTSTIPKGEYEFVVTYKGEVGTAGVGVYSMPVSDEQLINESNQKFDLPNWIIATQGEATYARKIFFCFDDPTVRIPIEFSIKYKDQFKDIAVLSNEKIKSREVDHQGNVEVIFNPTKPLPSYLFAFALGALISSKKVNTKLGEQRIWCVPNKLFKTSYALDIAYRSTEFLENLLGENTLSSKVDHIALPEFVFGGMENPGCIMYRETALLVDEDFSTKTQRLRVMSVIAHELAHMWFGNQIGVASWDYTFLKEGAAMYLESVACEKILADLGENPVAIHEDNSLGLDNAQIAGFAESEKAIEAPLTSRDDSDSNYSFTTYYKTLVLLFAIDKHSAQLGFQDAIKKVFRKISDDFAYKAIHTDDYWDNLPKEVHSLRQQFRENSLPQLNLSLVDGKPHLKGDHSTVSSVDDSRNINQLWKSWERYSIYVYEDDTALIDTMLTDPTQGNIFTCTKDLWWTVRLDKSKIDLWKYFINKAMGLPLPIETKQIILRALIGTHNEHNLIFGESSSSWLMTVVGSINDSELKATPEYIQLAGDTLLINDPELINLATGNFKKILNAYQLNTHSRSVSAEHFIASLKVLCAQGNQEAIDFAFQLVDDSRTPQLAMIGLSALASSQDPRVITDVTNRIGDKIKYSDVAFVLRFFWSSSALSEPILDYAIKNWSKLKENISDVLLSRFLSGAYNAGNSTSAKKMLKNLEKMPISLAQGEADAGIFLTNHLLYGKQKFSRKKQSKRS